VLREQGHEVRLIPAQFVKPYRKSKARAKELLLSNNRRSRPSAVNGFNTFLDGLRKEIGGKTMLRGFKSTQTWGAKAAIESQFRMFDSYSEGLCQHSGVCQRLLRPTR
jgi:transposase